MWSVMNVVCFERTPCGNTSLSLRFSYDFLVSTKFKAIFAVTSFRNSSAQFFKRGVLTLVSCPILSTQAQCRITNSSKCNNCYQGRSQIFLRGGLKLWKQKPCKRKIACD